MKRLPAFTLALALAAAMPAFAETAPNVTGTLAAGDYKLDKAHSTVTFRVSHLGFSFYSARFTTFDAGLQIDPADPAKAILVATIDPNSLDVPSPPDGFLDELRGPNWLDTAKYPDITFRSTAIELTGGNTANVTGDFTLHGVTKPVVLAVTFNGGYEGHPMDPHARIGFSARAAIKRSDFGVSLGIPEPGTTMGVGDDVEIIIETEFSGPPLKEATP